MCEQPFVACDQIKGATVREPDVVDARVRAVQDTEAHTLVADREVRVVDAVDKDRAAEEADRAEGGTAEVERAVVVKSFILDDEWDVVDAVVVWERECVDVFVVEDEEAGDAAVDLIGRLSHWMRV